MPVETTFAVSRRRRRMECCMERSHSLGLACLGGSMIEEILNTKHYAVSMGKWSSPFRAEAVPLRQHSSVEHSGQSATSNINSIGGSIYSDEYADKDSQTFLLNGIPHEPVLSKPDFR